jgi:hypothetical protein
MPPVKARHINFEDPRILKVSKVKCLKSILFHTRYFFHHQYKRKFVIGDHHQKICEALERVLRGLCKRLIINIAPRYGKTELAVKSFISHGLALNPSAKFIHLSYGDDVALDNSEAVKDLVQSAEYQKLFPEVQVKKDAKAKNKWYTTENGGVLARAAGGQVTGFGAGQVDQEEEDTTEDEDLKEFLQALGIAYSGDPLDDKFNFAGAIIIDDPIKPDDADQDTQREKVNMKFDSTIRNRVNSRDTPIIVIMQRLHPMDLAGYLQREDEADQWEVIELPCLIADEEADENFDEVTGESLGRWKALWPFKHTVAELLKLRKANDLVFDRQYMQDPNPKHGLLFPTKLLRFYTHSDTDEALLDPDFSLVCVDPANEGGDDFAAGVFKLVGKDIFLTKVIYNTEGTDHNEPAVVSLVLDKDNAVKETAVEGVMGWKETAMRIRENLQNKGYAYEFRIVRPRKQKHSRILNRASFIRNNMLFRKDYMRYPQYAKFMRVLTSYLKIQEAGKSNKHDDAPDLCEMAGAYYEKNFTHLW